MWRLRQTLAAVCEETGEDFADSQHPAAKTLRSLRHQRTWWRSLSPNEQDVRRAQQRRRVAELHPADRRSWFDWLDRRADIAAVAERIDANDQRPYDLATIIRSPITVHCGMLDPGWRTTGTAPPPAPPPRTTEFRHGDEPASGGVVTLW